MQCPRPADVPNRTATLASTDAISISRLNVITKIRLPEQQVRIMAARRHMKLKEEFQTMHMFPQHHTFILDPLEERRLKSGRPASRAEIYQRHLKESGKNARFITYDQVIRDPAAATSRPSETPGFVENIRRSLSDALATAADRIAPETT